MIDVCAYVPRHVHQLADAVADRTGHYVHISSISAYDDAAPTGDEDSPLYADPPDATIEAITDDTYGPLKAMANGPAGSASATTTRRSSARPTSPARTTRLTGSRTGRGGWPGWRRRHRRSRARRCRSSTAVTSARSSSRAPIPARRAFDGVGPWALLEEFLAEITPPGVEARFVDVGGAALGAAGTPLPLLSAEPEPAP